MLERFKFIGARVTSASRIRIGLFFSSGALATSATGDLGGSGIVVKRFKFIVVRVTSVTWIILCVETYYAHASKTTTNSLHRTIG